MSFNISEFISQGLPLGGARSSHFQIVINTPNGVPNVGARMAVTAKAGSIPDSTLGSIPVRYFGREVKFAGSRIFQPWIVTVLNDEDFEIRQALETWSNLINTHEQNLRAQQLRRNNEYRMTGYVTQFAKTGQPVRTYEFVNMWPQELSPIELSWDNAEAIQEYNVTFEYDFWRIVAPSTTGSLNV